MEELLYDYIIIGGGVAGLASAQYAARGGLKTVVIQGSSFGGQVMQIADLENYPGVYPNVSGADFIEKMQEQTLAFGAKMEYGPVTSIDKVENTFSVKTKSKAFKAPAVLIATGAVHRNLGVPGEKELTGRGVSYCATCDGPFFKNKRIVVVGGGDSACSEAIYLSSLSDDVKIIHRRDSFRAQQAVIDKMLKSGVQPVYDSVVKSVNGSNKVESVTVENVKTGKTEELACDAVFVFVGMLPQNELVDMLKKDDQGYIITGEDMETSVPGLFAAGDVRAKSFRQIVTAVADGAIAANSAKKYRE
jgi:thioredoxin reductase (NADPH)